MRPIESINKVFHFAVDIKGELNSTFVFETSAEMYSWLNSEFIGLKYTTRELDGLKIGENCRVRGDGDEVYTITAIKQYENHRYGFHLNSGFCEEVQKCSKVGLWPNRQLMNPNEYATIGENGWMDINTPPNSDRTVQIAWDDYSYGKGSLGFYDSIYGKPEKKIWWHNGRPYEDGKIMAWREIVLT